MARVPLIPKVIKATWSYLFTALACFACAMIMQVIFELSTAGLKWTTAAISAGAALLAVALYKAPLRQEPHSEQFEQKEQDSLVPLPTEALNNLLRVLLNPHAYLRYVYPAMEDLRHEYSAQKRAGNHTKACLCLVRGYVFMIFPVVQSFVSMLYRLSKLI